MVNHRDKTVKEFLDVLATHPHCVTYVPLRDEVDPWGIPFLPKNYFKNTYILPQGTEQSPSSIAEVLRGEYRGKNVCILIPGTRFDCLGTRYGRGNGWFDRFLACVPVEWVRVGITDLAHLAQTPLERKSWDQPVDWILYKKEKGYEIIETNARS